MLPIKVGKYSLTMPQGQQELSHDAYKQISALVMLTDTEETRAKVIWKLIIDQLTKKQRRIFKTGIIDPYAILKLSEIIGWIWKRYEVTGESQIIPWAQEFTHKRKTYLLPQPNLDDVSINEFAYINMYLDMIADGDAEAAFGLAAMICRPLKPKRQREALTYDGNPRILFNPDLVDVEKFREVPEWVIWNVYDFCLRAQLMIHKRYEPIFAGEKSAGPNFGWLGMVMNIAETGTYGIERQVKQTNLHTICIYSTKKILEQKRQQAEMEEIKNKNARS